MDALELACALAKQNSATVCLLTVIGAPSDCRRRTAAGRAEP